MTSLKKLSAIQLNKILGETQAELKRRENIDKAQKEIHAILKKYKITMAELESGSTGKRAASKARPAKKLAVRKNSAKTAKSGSQKDNRSAVSAKYHNPQTGDKWSGRGRAPVWVARICQDEMMDIEKFKADPRFRL